MRKSKVNSNPTKADIIARHADLVLGLHGAGFSSRRIAEVVKKELGINVSYQVILEFLRTPDRKDRVNTVLADNDGWISEMCRNGFSAMQITKKLGAMLDIPDLSYSRVRFYLRENAKRLGWTGRKAKEAAV